MMKTATSTFHPPLPSLRERLWRLYRNHPLAAGAAMVSISALFALSTKEDLGFWLCLPIAAAVVATVFNFVDLTTRVFDAGRRGLGVMMTFFALGGAAAVAYAALLMLIMWSYLP